MAILAVSPYSAYSSIDWLTDANILTPAVVEWLSSQCSPELAKDKFVGLPDLLGSPLVSNLLQLTVDPMVANRLIVQLRSTACEPVKPDAFTILLNEMESIFQRQWAHLRHSDWDYHNYSENRWFWTASLLFMNNLRQLFATEVHRITEVRN